MSNVENVITNVSFASVKKKESTADYLERIRKARKHKTSCFSFICQKGGVGKTTITSNVALTLAKRGFKVLCIDSDSQASFTGLCNVLPPDIDFEQKGLADAYELYSDYGNDIPKEKMDELIVRPKFRKAKTYRENGKYKTVMEEQEFGFDLLPGDYPLGNVELGLAKVNNGGFYLRGITEYIKRVYDYDYILIDCPPALGLLAYNAITAATEGVVVPINLEIMTLRGARNLIKVVAEIQELLKGIIVHKGVLGIVMNEFMSRSALQKEYRGQLDMWWPLKKFDTKVPQRTACDKAHYEGLFFIQKSKEAEEIFDDLCDEIIYEDCIRADETESIIHKEFGFAYKQQFEEAE